MKKTFSFLIFAVFTVALRVQTYFSWVNERRLEAEYRGLKEKLDTAMIEKTKLQAELHRILDPENLEKELRSRFNYKNPGEKMIIIVPPKETSTTPRSF